MALGHPPRAAFLFHPVSETCAWMWLDVIHPLGGSLAPRPRSFPPAGSPAPASPSPACSRHSDKNDLLTQKSDEVAPLLRVVRALMMAGTSLCELPWVTCPGHLSPTPLLMPMCSSHPTPSRFPTWSGHWLFPLLGTLSPRCTHGFFLLFLQVFTQMSPSVVPPSPWPPYLKWKSPYPSGPPFLLHF